MVLLYVDDCLVISFEADKALSEIGKYFQLKPNSIGPPKIYLGGKVIKVTLPNGVQAWSFSATQYVREAVKNVEKFMSKHGYTITSKKIGVPLPTSYCPELNGSKELDPEQASQYQSFIAVLR